MEKLITVKGTGKLNAKPDSVEIRLSYEATEDREEDAVKHGMRQQHLAQQCAEQCGLQAEDLKTASFNVEARYRSYRDKNGDYKQKFIGYGCSQTLNLRIPLDMELLSRVCKVFTAGAEAPELRLAFTVKDPEPLKDELLRNAVTNARRRAEVLTAASGVQLGELVRIDYSWGELRFVSETNVMPDLCCKAIGTGAGDEMDFTPEDINLEETVTLMWEIA